MSRDDDRLLELLGRSLAPESREPAPERVAQIRARAEAGRASYTVDKRRRTKG
ncbi:MAG: hypothetical protein H0U16_00020 [Actinobacteria bacterium]|nr:hypothetical protein [Actinomycetota bacterium]